MISLWNCNLMVSVCSLSVTPLSLNSAASKDFWPSARVFLWKSIWMVSMGLWVVAGQLISRIWDLRHCLYTPAKWLNFKHEMFLLSFMGQQEKEQFKRHEDVFFKTEIIDKMPSSTSWQLLNLLSVFSGEYSTSVCRLSYPCERPESVRKRRSLASWSQ